MEEVNQKLLTKIQEDSRAESQEMQESNKEIFEAFRAENCKLRAAIMEKWRIENKTFCRKLTETRSNIREAAGNI